MTGDRTSQAAGPRRGGTMQHWRYIALHTLGAGAFIFLLQRYIMGASLDLSLLWALAFGGCAAGLAYRQTHR
jgi:hypothetical protein